MLLQFKTRAVEAFRQQPLFGAPSNADEFGLRQLRNQLRPGKLRVKLHLRHTLHAKLYLASLDWCDRNLAFHRYARIGSTAHVTVLLAKIVADPTCIFWG